MMAASSSPNATETRPMLEPSPWLIAADIGQTIVAVCLFAFSLLLIVVFARDAVLRKHYAVFSIKFVVDASTALLYIGALACDEATRANEAQLILLFVPFIQCLLLACECVDWSVATFRPLRFHHSSLSGRLVPHGLAAAAALLCAAALIAVRAAQPENPAYERVVLIVAAAVTSGAALLAALLLSAILIRQRESQASSTIGLHVLLCVVCLLLPAIAVLVFVVLSLEDITPLQVSRWLSALLAVSHTLVHSAIFLARHPDVHGALTSRLKRLAIICMR